MELVDQTAGLPGGVYAVEEVVGTEVVVVDVVADHVPDGDQDAVPDGDQRAFLAAVGGPAAVNDWVRRAGIQEFELTRDIATLVRDDGEINPAVAVDIRDSATPRAMVQLLAGLYQGKWLSASSRRVIIGAMERCRTGTRRIPAMMPGGVTVAHKTGSLNNTSSDIGLITTPDGRTIAVAIYVTGQGSRPAREAKIANIARAIYDGYLQQPATQWVNAEYTGAGGSR